MSSSVLDYSSDALDFDSDYDGEALRDEELARVGASSPISVDNLHTPPPTGVILRYQGYLDYLHELNQSDLDALQNGDELNDRVIDVLMAMTHAQMREDQPVTTADTLVLPTSFGAALLGALGEKSSVTAITQASQRISRYHEKFWNSNLVLIPLQHRRHWVLAAVTNLHLARDRTVVKPPSQVPDMKDARPDNAFSVSPVIELLKEFLRYLWSAIHGGVLEYFDAHNVKGIRKLDHADYEDIFKPLEIASAAFRRMKVSVLQQEANLFTCLQQLHGSTPAASTAAYPMLLRRDPSYVRAMSPYSDQIRTFPDGMSPEEIAELGADPDANADEENDVDANLLPPADASPVPPSLSPPSLVSYVSDHLPPPDSSNLRAGSKRPRSPSRTGSHKKNSQDQGGNQSPTQSKRRRRTLPLWGRPISQNTQHPSISTPLQAASVLPDNRLAYSENALGGPPKLSLARKNITGRIPSASLDFERVSDS
ncbi:hypothetical protein FRC00_002882 [Tulasnella sp. 408]|nr:hypothetical protein FRC00_002882 [Tulasnella sp. 408]